MRTFIYLIILFVCINFLSSCAGVQIAQVGKLNMISNRNVESNSNYVLIRNYMGGSKKELKKARAETIEEAIDGVVRATPGGEYLKNVKIYIVSSKNSKYFAVEGDVWGIEGQESMRGFKIGDKVQWKTTFDTKVGIVTGLKDDKTALIKEEGDDTSKAIEYEKLIKISN